MAYGDGQELRGVGGWLAFFVIAIGILSPAGMLISTATGLYGNPEAAAIYGASWNSLVLFEWVLAAVTIAGCWFIAWRLLKVENWTTVRITIAGIWIVSVGSFIADFIGVSYATGIPVGTLMGAAADIRMVRPFVFCVIWTAYFLTSKRVANTYRGTPAEVAEVFD